MPTPVGTRVGPARAIAPDFFLVVFKKHPVSGGKPVWPMRRADGDEAVPHLERALIATTSHLRERCSQSTRTRAQGTTD